ncbi:MAG: hypothetical protein ACPGU4_13695, partial [Flavobacteriales bacterium]
MKKLLLFLVLTVAVGLLGVYNGSLSEENRKSNESQLILDEILALDNQLFELNQGINESDVELRNLAHLWAEKGIGFVVYNQGNAVDWTTNAIPFAVSFDKRHQPTDGIIKLKNAWYLCRTIAADEQLLVAYALLKTNYDFENEYVKNRWNSTFSANQNFGFTLSNHNSQEISLIDEVSSVRLRESSVNESKKPSWNTLLWLAFLVLLLLSIWHAANWISEISSVRIGNSFFVLLAVCARGLLWWWELPKGLYELELFAPTLHATSSLIPSLGDFILHLIFLWLIVLRISKSTIAINNKWLQRILGISLPVLLLWPVHESLHILVVNSSFSLDLNDPFSLSIYSFFGLLTSFLIFFNYYLIFRFLLKLVSPENRQFAPTFILLFISAGLVAFLLGGNFLAITTAVAGGLVFGFLLLVQNWMKNQSGIYLHTPNIFAFSLLACIILTGIETNNEHDSRMSIARKLHQQEDPISEFLFESLAENLQANRQLRAALTSSPISSESVLSIINEKLSYDHWNRYQSFVDIYNNEGGLMVSDRERTGPNYFELQSEYDVARPTMSGSLRYVGHLNQKGGYLARIEIRAARSNKNLVLFIRLIPEKIDDILGFTDLFVDQGISSAQELEGYSYAIYNNGALEEQHGKF